jgi:hypothetical protein
MASSEKTAHAAPAAGSVVEVLQAMASELSQMAQVSDRLQLLISAALVADGAANAEHMREFQAIDLLVQRLHGTAIFTECLAAIASPDWRIDALAAAAAVPLSDLARRLGGESDAPARPGHADDGDLELFG